jgi:FtsP/CotA-like multicopper oxidase with cupredoxin domain
MAGALVIQGGLDDITSIRKLPERIMVLQSTAFDNGGNVDTFHVPGATPALETFHFINGQLTPTITVRQGRPERWRLINATVNQIYEIALEDHTFQQIASDGNPFDQQVEIDTLTIAPGQRAELLVTPGDPGTYDLTRKTLFPTVPTPTAKLHATVVVQSASPLKHKDLPPKLLVPFTSLTRFAANRERTIRFSSTGTTFFIDGEVFDPTRVDQLVRLGTIEDWTIVNEDGNPHPFHIHTNPFQVTHINGQRVTAHALRDTELLPPSAGDSITIRMRFTDFVGKSVFHCHLLPHQDHGMMAVIKIDFGSASLGPPVVAKDDLDLQTISWDNAPAPSHSDHLAAVPGTYTCPLPDQTAGSGRPLDGWTLESPHFENS